MEKQQTVQKQQSKQPQQAEAMPVESAPVKSQPVALTPQTQTISSSNINSTSKVKKQTNGPPQASAPTKDSIVHVSGLHKNFRVGNQDVRVLRGIDITVNYGDFVIIFGPSGCGKSTLLHIMLGLEPPTEGTITFLGEDLYVGKTEDQQADFRKKHVGMVFQQANWIKSLKVLENVAFPLLLLGRDKLDSIQRSIKILDQLGMLQWASYVPTELSGGQQQKISLARALINNPEIIFADEPTGNLDYKSGQDIMKLLYDMNKQQGKTIIMVTHDLEYLRYADTAVQMLDGEVIGVYQEKDMEKLTSELQFKRVSKIKATQENPNAQNT